MDIKWLFLILIWAMLVCHKSELQGNKLHYTFLIIIKKLDIVK